MALYSRSGRPRPQSGGIEVAIWYFMRLSGVALFVLALTHFSVQHFVSDPKDQTAAWIFADAWNNALRRGLDWLMLIIVVAHMTLGMRTVTMDYLKGGKRVLALSALWTSGALMLVMGSVVVLTVKLPGA
jgi:succinate dehydrogenase / fumarate reductase, membrane anchor subunit